MNLQFLQALAQLRKTRQRDFDWSQWKGIQPNADGQWTNTPWQGNTPQVIVYDPKTGKAFPNPQAAQSAGVINFSYNLPPGMKIDWSYWDQFANQPMQENPASNPYVYNQTLPFQPTDYSSNHKAPLASPAAAPPGDESAGEPEEEVAVDPFSGVSAGRLAEAKRYADAGMMGRAKQQVELGGGTWDEKGALSKTMRSEAAATDNYGGDFKDQDKMNAVLDKVTSDGKMGKAKKAYEAAGNTWSKAVHKRLKATYNRTKDD